jgi:mRNA guanylyltransferase
MRFRDDKDDGNHISTVESVIESIGDAVTKEELLRVCPEIRARWKHRDDPSQPYSDESNKKRRLDSSS